MKRSPELNFNEFASLSGTEILSVMLRQKYILENDMEVSWVRSNCTDTFHIRRDDYPSKNSVVYFVSVRDVITFLEIYGKESVVPQEVVAPSIESVLTSGPRVSPKN